MKNRMPGFFKNNFIVDINGRQHSIEIKANTFRNKIKISVDDNVCIEEDITGMERHLFYPMKIDNTDVVVELVDEGYYFKKDIYIESISINTGYRIDKEKFELQRKVDKGFINYLQKNIIPICKFSGVCFLYFILDLAISLYKDRDKNPFNLNGLILALVFYIFSSIIISFLYYILDWLSARHKLKKWDSYYHEL